MCGRFFIESEEQEFLEIIEEIKQQEFQLPPSLNMKTSGEIFPGDIVPVMSDFNSWSYMKWGFSLKDRLVINARSETAHKIPLFSESMKNHRCLILASAYFEWQKQVEGKVKYRFYNQNHPIYLAGCYRYEGDFDIAKFVILTKPAETEFTAIHDRMPVIIPQELIKNWFELTPDLFTIPKQQLICQPEVDFTKNKLKHHNQ